MMGALQLPLNKRAKESPLTMLIFSSSCDTRLNPLITCTGSLFHNVSLKHDPGSLKHNEPSI